jgi:hypothetical protein
VAGGPGAKAGRDGPVGEMASCQCHVALAHYEKGGAGSCVGKLVIWLVLPATSTTSTVCVKPR